MKFQREKDALEALEAVEAYVKERLTDMRLKARALDAELAKLKNAIQILEQRAQTLQVSKVHWITPISPDESAPPGTMPTDALQAIISILESSSGPMRVRSIAEYAYNKGLISSSKGLKGVTSIVSNKVSQNSPKILTSVGWGWWDLTARRKPKNPVGPIDVANQTEETILDEAYAEGSPEVSELPAFLMTILQTRDLTDEELAAEALNRGWNFKGKNPAIIVRFGLLNAAKRKLVERRDGRWSLAKHVQAETTETGGTGGTKVAEGVRMN